MNNTNRPSDTSAQTNASWKRWLAETSAGTRLLAGALALQLVLAGTLVWQGQRNASFQSDGQLVAFTPAAIDKLTIRAGGDEEGSSTDQDSADGATETKTITLEKDGDGWRLADGEALPADTGKVDDLIASLASLEPGLPVATHASSHAQLDVAEDDFQRRITLQTGDEVAVDLLVGSSPGFRKAHVRKVDEEATYAAKLNTFDLPVKVDDWLDKTLIALNNITALSTSDIELRREGDQWVLSNRADAEDERILDQDRVATLVGGLEALRVLGVAEPDAMAGAEATSESDSGTDTNVETKSGTDVGASNADDEDEGDGDAKTETVALVIETGGESIELNMTRRGDTVTAQRSDRPGHFRISAAELEPWLGLTQDALLIEPVDDQLGAETEADEQSTDSTSSSSE